MDEELEKFKREISLAELAASYGYVLDGKEYHSGAKMKGKGGTIVIKTDKDGHGVFFETGENRSGSVIDFVMWQEGVSLGYARKILREFTGAQQNFSFPTAPAFLKSPPASSDRAGLVAKWGQMQPCKSDYLRKRGLTPLTIAKFAGHIRTDERGNTCFMHQDESGILAGWEIKNKGFTGNPKDGSKALFSCYIGCSQQEQPPIIVITESGIDTMSFYQLNATAGLYISIGGNMSPKQERQLEALLTSNPASLVLTATDNDREGDKYADKILAMRPDAVRAAPPMGKDWNDTLNQREARAR